MATTRPNMLSALNLSVTLPKSELSPKTLQKLYDEHNKLPSENHNREQYFWTTDTIKRMADFIQDNYKYPCLLCCPSLGQELERRKIPHITTLDIDKRFESIKSFEYFNIFKYTKYNVKTPFDVIIIDPPFYTIPSDQMYKAIRHLSQDNYDTHIVFTNLESNSDTIVNTFCLFLLQPTTYHPTYRTLNNQKNNKIVYYINFDVELITPYLM